MAMLDPNIALGVQPLRIENPMNQLGQLLQVQNAQRQNELGAMQLDQSRQDRASMNALNDAYRGATGPDGGIDRNGLYQRLAQGGLGSKIPGLQEQFAKTDKEALLSKKAGTDIRKNEMEIVAGETKAKRDAVDRHLQMGGMVRTPEDYQAWIKQGLDSGLFDMQKASALIQNTPNNPQALAAEVQRIQMGGLPLKEQLDAQLAQILEVSNGQQKQFIDKNPRSATFGQSVLPGVQMKADPNAVLSATTSVENSKRSANASMANASATREVAKSTRDAALITARAGDETAIRKEFASLPEVTKYKNAIPAYNSVVKAAAINNPQADINLIYGLAKLYDPDSVVREGEYDTIANSQAIPEWLKGQAQRLVGGGRLTDATKKQIIQQADIRLNSYKGEYDSSRGAFEDIVKRRGLEPQNVLTPVGSSVAAKPTANKLTPAEQAELDALKKRFNKP